MSKQSIEQVRRAFEKWRSERGGKMLPTPDNLRKMAIELCAREGQSLVCEKVGLGSSLLWKWKREFRERDKSPGTGRTPKRSSKSRPVVNAQPGLKFVDLTRKNFSIGEGVAVEWMRTDGTKMKLTGMAAQDIAGFAAQFLSSCGSDQL